MAKQQVVHNLSAVRLGPGAFSLLEKNKTRGRFFCQAEDGILLWINDSGKPKRYECKDMDECIEMLNELNH